MVLSDNSAASQLTPGNNLSTMLTIAALGQLRRVGQLSRKELFDLGPSRELVAGIARKLVAVGLALERKAGREKILMRAAEQFDGPTVTMGQIAAKRARNSKEPFIYPRAQRYDLREYFRHVLHLHRPDDSSAENIELRFAPRLRHYLLHHPLHGSQKLVDTDDRGWFTLRLHVYRTDEVRRLVAAYGAEVEEVG